jgi:hypothetical protein
MIYIYASRNSTSAKLLSFRLKGKRIKHPRIFKPGDVLVNWGDRNLGWAEKQKVPILNRDLQASKKTEIFALQAAGLPVPPASQNKPPDAEGWCGRTAHHTHGRDFLKPPASPDFWVKRLTIKEEYRIHVFNYDGKDDIRILRWGKKEPRSNSAHSWVRSDSGGWRLAYNLPHQTLPEGLRPVAKRALKVLKYDFGAVDMGLTSTGKPIIFEVNSAPGLDEGGRTIDLYAEALRQRIK